MRDVRSALVAGLVLVPLPALSATYYVATTGSDSAAGTLAAPFRTMQFAAGKTVAGDTVLVRGGSYAFSGSADPLTITRSGTASAYITYQAYPGEKPIITFGGGAWEGINVRASYIIVDGFSVVGPALSYTSKGWGDANGPSKATGTGNESCIVGGASASGGPYWHHIVIRNNDTSYCSESGIQVLHADYVTVEANTVHDNSWWSAYAGSGISVYEPFNSDDSSGYKIFVLRNTTYGNRNLVGNSNDNWQITDGEGIILDDFDWSQNTGVGFFGRAYVANNLAYSNGGPGIEVFHSQHADVVANTVYRNQTNHIGDEGELAPSVAGDVRLNNNIAVAVAGKKANGGAWNGGVYTANLYVGAIQTTGAGDIQADPQFVAPDSNNFALQAGSPAIDTGVAALAPSVDITGAARPSGGGYDRGAYEYAGGQPPPPSSDTVVLTLSEDYYQGDAHFVARMDGALLGSGYVTARRANGATQQFSYVGTWAAGQHTVTVSFDNDKYGGSSRRDRNLIINQIAFDGRGYLPAAVVLASNGSVTQAVAK